MISWGSQSVRGVTDSSWQRRVLSSLPLQKGPQAGRELVALFPLLLLLRPPRH